MDKSGHLVFSWTSVVLQQGGKERRAERLEVGFKKGPGMITGVGRVSNGTRDLHRGFYDVLTSPSAALKAIDHVFQHCYYAYCPCARQIGLHH